MSVEKKEAYLKRRRDNYHKRKANMAACNNEGLHLDSSKSTPQTNHSTQSAQPLSLGVSQICSTQMFRTPTNASQQASNQLFHTPLMDVTHIASNQFGRTPIYVSQTDGKQLDVTPKEASQNSYYGRNLLTSFQNVMTSPGKNYCCIRC
jgi:hypothetical protein